MHLTVTDDGQLIWMCEHCGIAHIIKEDVQTIIMTRPSYYEKPGKRARAEWKYCPFCGKSSDNPLKKELADD